jgi:predicted AAA+ superfamily ATPase
MFIARSTLLDAVEDGLARSPAVVLLGPRQVGKTTLARQIADERAGSAYLDLEAPGDLRKLDDARGFLEGRSDGLTVIDEVHRVPALFAELRGIIDERRRRGRDTGQFLLLGSASLDLIQRVSETLAGRVVYLDVPPLTAEETAAAGVAADAHWLRGGFPNALLAGSDRESLRWRQDFIRSYLEREVPLFAPRMPASLIGRLWTMLAHGQGAILNASRLAQGLGVSAPMIGRYLDLLQDLFLLRRLTPWSGNLAKRLVRSPKVYLTDSGLVHALLEIEGRDALLGHPVVGPSWEGFVIENLLAAAGPGRVPLYYRTHDGAEVDLVFERAGRPEMAFEIKRSSAPRMEPGFAIACDDMAVEQRFCVAPVSEAYPARGGVQVLPLPHATRLLRATGGGG